MTEQQYSHNSSSQQLADNSILRAEWHDYREPGYYLITIVTEGRVPAFGRLVGESEDEAAIELSPLGKALEAEIESQRDRHQEIDIEEFVIMEDHCHLFVYVKEKMEDHLGKVVWGIKFGTTGAYLKALNERYGGVHRVEGARLSRDERLRGGNTAFKQGYRPQGSASPAWQGPEEGAGAAWQSLEEGSAGAAWQGPEEGSASPAWQSQVRCGVSASGAILVPPLWQKGYHDRIVTKRGQIARQKAYITRNPGRLWAKRHANRAFTRVVEERFPLPLSLAQQLKDTALYWDQRREVLNSQFSHRHDGRHYAESYLELVAKFLRKRVLPCPCGNTARNTAAAAPFPLRGRAQECEAALAQGEAGVEAALAQGKATPAQGEAGVEAFLWFKVCGNRELLYAGRPLVRVRISRSVTKEDFETEVKRVLDLCEREGAVAISPFRSWSEKAVLRMLRMNGYDHIILTESGMWNGWKPQDGSTAEIRSQRVPAWFERSFGAGSRCGNTASNMASGFGAGLASGFGAGQGDLAEVYAGRCAFVALWHDRPKGVTAGKADCEIMNEVALLMERVSEE